jgi:protein phosphatase
MNEIVRTMSLAASSANGLKRKNNEDAYIIGTDFTISARTMVPVPFHSPAGVVLAIADGIGGENAGEIASSLAMSSVCEFFLNHLPPEIPINPVSKPKIFSIMKDCLLFADSGLKEYARNHPETRGMGTTVVLAWLLENSVYVSWCGDSRAYIFRNGKDIYMLTYDHNLLQELLAEDSVSTSEVLGHPAHNILTRYIGDTHTAPQPDFNGTFMLKGDVILLCSDGLTTMLPDSEIENIISNNPDIDICKNELINAANRAGGYDNITVVLAEIIS